MQPETRAALLTVLDQYTDVLSNVIASIEQVRGLLAITEDVTK